MPEVNDSPARRPDLVLTPGSEDGREFVTVHDPRTGRYFRLREVEGFILSLLDGERSLEDVHSLIMREYPGVTLRLPTLAAFVRRLESLGMLQSSVLGTKIRIPFHKRILQIKLGPVPVEPLLRLLAPFVRFVYQPIPLLLALSLVLSVGYWAFFSAEEIASHTPAFHTVSAWLILGAAILSINFLHEMGHGMTCHYFGARCNGIGIFLLYGLPCFYCDVSGAWTLSSRTSRMLIALGGLGWQLPFGALAFVAWKMLPPETLPARYLYSVFGMCGVMALFNFFPFLKLDGYYLIADWLRVPNLRDKAMHFVSQKWKSLFFTVPAPQPPARERRIYAWFGFFCWLSSLVPVMLALKVSHWLLEKGHGTGALVVGGFFMAVVISWFRTLLASVTPAGGTPAASSPATAAPPAAAAPPTAPAPPPPASAPPSSSATTSAPAAAPGSGGNSRPAPASPSGGTPAGAGSAGDGQQALKRARPKPAAFVALALLIVGGVVFWNAKWTHFVASPCTLEAFDRKPVRPEVEGVLQKVVFDEGAVVRKGETFAILESFDLVKRREQLGNEVNTIGAQTQMIQGQAPILEDENRRDVERAAREVQTAKHELDERSNLFPVRRDEADKKVQEAWTALEAAKRIAERAQADETAANEDVQPPPKLRAVKERIERVRSQRALAKIEVERATLLVNEGALQRQRLDQLTTDAAVLERDESALDNELSALKKDLADSREDAELEVRQRQAAYDMALESKRRVERETRPEKLEDAREEIAGREELLRTTRRLRASANLKRSEAAVKGMEARPKQVEMERLGRRIHQTRVLAPASGIVSTPRLSEKVGRKFAKGETIAVIEQLSTLRARISVEERDIAGIRRGQKVELRVAAFPDRMFSGRVESVSPRTTGGGNRGAYEVGLSIPNTSNELRPGITGYAKIYLGKRPLREVVFRRLYRYFRTEVWTWF